MCGSDLAAVFFKTSVALSAVASLPAVFGHEILARVLQPPRGSALREGDRVVVDGGCGHALAEEAGTLAGGTPGRRARGFSRHNLRMIA